MVSHDPCSYSRLTTPRRVPHTRRRRAAAARRRARRETRRRRRVRRARDMAPRSSSARPSSLRAREDAAPRDATRAKRRASTRASAPARADDDEDDGDGDDGVVGGAHDAEEESERADRAGVARARREEMERTEEGSDSEERETAQEKRVRLAKAYLERLRAEQAAEDTDEEEDEGEGKNLDSHTRLANRLLEDAQRKSGHQRAAVADGARASTTTETRCWRGHKRAVTGLTLTEDDRTAYSVSKDGSIFGWDIETEKRIKFPRAPETVVDPSQGGGGPQAPPTCGAHVVLCCAVSGERNLFVTGGADKRVHVWDTRSRTHVTAFAGHRGAVTGLAFRHGTGQLFSCSEDRTVKIWSLDDMAYVDTLFGHQDRCINIDAQRRERIVTVGADRSTRFWKVPEDSQLVLRPPEGGGQAESCAFTAHDHWITGAQDGTVAIWNTQRKRAAQTWLNAHGFADIVAPKGFTDEDADRATRQRAAAQAAVGISERDDGGVGSMASWVNAVHVGKGTDFAASGAADGAIRLWKTSHEGEPLVPLECIPARGFVNSIQVASSGRFVLAGMGQEPRLGRWGRDSAARNGVQLHSIEIDQKR